MWKCSQAQLFRCSDERRKAQRERKPPPKRKEPKEKASKKEIRKRKAKGSEGRNRLMENRDTSWFTQVTGLAARQSPFTSQKCAFVHCCPVPKSDGSLCGSLDHKAITCPHRSRRIFGWRKRQPASGRQCPSRNTLMKSQRKAEAISPRQGTTNGSVDFVQDAMQYLGASDGIQPSCCS